MNFALLLAALGANAVTGFVPSTFMPSMKTGVQSSSSLQMALSEGQKPILIGVAADSGCGKATFMRRLTGIFGGAQVGPLGGGFDGGGWETNTLVSDTTTVLCLDDFHLN